MAIYSPVQTTPYLTRTLSLIQIENEYLQVRFVLGWLLYASRADLPFILLFLSKPIPAQLFQPPNRPIPHRQRVTDREPGVSDPNPKG